MIRMVRKLRRLPERGRILVKVGDAVAHDTKVGKLDYIPGQLYRVDVAEGLGIAPKYLQASLVKRPGDWVVRGETLAATDEFDTERRVASPENGYVGLVSNILGTLFIREPLAAGPKGPVTLRGEDVGVNLASLITDIRARVGQIVETGEVLASGGMREHLDAKDPAKRWVTLEMVAPCFGKVLDINRRAGTITINPIRQETDVSAHIDGAVTGIDGDACVEITAVGHYIQGVIGYGGEQVGQLTAIPEADSRDIEVGDLPAGLEGRVILGRHGITSDALRACADRGAVGVVVGSIRYTSLKDFLGVEPLQMLGANAHTPLVIILINGFGRLPMPEHVYAELAALAGRTASLDGSTQLRAGVLRPEVFVAADPAATPAEAAEQSRLAPGARVAVIREPAFGTIGRIIALSSEPVMVESGAVVPTATIADEQTGNQVVVPQPNLKIIGEVAR